MEKKELRIIDANLNRIGEGLRVLEDIGRLALDDAGLSQRLKDLRHSVARTDPALKRKLVSARDAAGDVGMDLEAEGEPMQRDLAATVIANSRRVQESLRVMEEMAKLPEISLDPKRFLQARFSLYTVEKEMLAGLEKAADSGGTK
jgi:thiamine-phosphate pyrophosphorylase